LLLFQRRYHRQHTFDETGAGLTLRATAPFAPQHPGTDRPLGRIIGRLDASNLGLFAQSPKKVYFTAYVYFNLLIHMLL
jgi:hypothetical protein